MVESKFYTLTDLHSSTNSFRASHIQEHQYKYPVLASLARDYLSAPGSSAAAERTFSAAADVATAVRGRLAPRTIEMCVGSRLWLREGVGITDDYEEVGLVLKSWEESVAKRKGKQRAPP